MVPLEAVPSAILLAVAAALFFLQDANEFGHTGAIRVITPQRLRWSGVARAPEATKKIRKGFHVGCPKMQPGPSRLLNHRKKDYLRPKDGTSKARFCRLRSFSNVTALL